MVATIHMAYAYNDWKRRKRRGGRERRGRSGATRTGSTAPAPTPVSQWCSRPDEKASNCYVGGDGAQMWPYCCVAFTELSAMLEMQDGHMPEGGSKCGAGECLRFDDDRAWYYNEVILDKWHRPWEPVLSDMIEAVAISPLGFVASTGGVTKTLAVWKPRK